MAIKSRQFPILVEKGQDGFYTVECPLLDGCYSQGKTVDEALKNIQEVIGICLAEENNRRLSDEYNPQEVSFHLVSI